MSVRSGLITAGILAVFGVVGRWALTSDLTVVAAAVWSLVVVGAGIYAYLLDQRLRSVEGVVGSAASALTLRQEIDSLQFDVALLEARYLLGKIADRSEPLWDDILALIQGAHIAHWCVSVEQRPTGTMLKFMPPPWSDLRIAPCTFGPPFLRSSIDDIGRVLAANGVPIGRATDGDSAPQGTPTSLKDVGARSKTAVTKQ
jgi:hypothetical protein